MGKDEEALQALIEHRRLSNYDPLKAYGGGREPCKTLRIIGSLMSRDQVAVRDWLQEIESLLATITQFPFRLIDSFFSESLFTLGFSFTRFLKILSDA